MAETTDVTENDRDQPTKPVVEHPECSSGMDNLVHFMNTSDAFVPCNVLVRLKICMAR